MSALSKWLRTLAWVACVFALGVVVFGAFVRLSDAGLSCPDWPTCYGHVTWPVQAAAVAKADLAFPERPVETHKAWREQGHRFLAGTLGLLVLAQALLAVVGARRRVAGVLVGVLLIGIGIPLYMHRLYVASSVLAALGELCLLGVVLGWRGGGWRRIAVLALAVVCLQALLGMWTVTWLLKPIVVTAHLLGGMATFGLLAWIALRLTRDAPARTPRTAWLGKAAAVGVALLAAQIFLGGWTSSNYAALACGVGSWAFPGCLGQWWPSMDFHQGLVLWRGIGVNFEGGILDAAARTAIQWLHRLGAVVVSIYLAGLAWRAARAGLGRYSAALAAALGLQLLLGIGNVTLGLPLPVAVAHNGGAALLLFCLLALCVRASGASAARDAGA